MSTHVIAKVQDVVGNAIVVDKKNHTHVLKAGDTLSQGAELKTDSGAEVTLAYPANGLSETLGENASFSLTSELLNFVTSKKEGGIFSMDPEHAAARVAQLAKSDVDKVHPAPHRESIDNPFIIPIALIGAAVPIEIEAARTALEPILEEVAEHLAHSTSHAAHFIPVDPLAQGLAFQLRESSRMAGTALLPVALLPVVLSTLDKAPIADRDSADVTEGGLLSVLAPGVLSNDMAGMDGFAAGGGVIGVRAANGDLVSAALTGVGGSIEGLYGTLHLNADGSYTYQSTADHIDSNATDIFVYSIKDGDGDIATDTLTINLTDITIKPDEKEVPVEPISSALALLDTGPSMVSTRAPLYNQDYVPEINPDPIRPVVTSPSTPGIIDPPPSIPPPIITPPVAVVNGTPTAIDDMGGLVTEDAENNALSGNVLSNDLPGANTPATLLSWSSSNTEALTELQKYGTLTLNNDGNWSYVLDNTRGATQALTLESKLSFDLNYTMQDADGDQSSAKLTIQVQGSNDEQRVAIATEGEGVTSVYETALALGVNELSNPAFNSDSREAVNGTFQVSATDGIKEISVLGTVFSLAQLQGFTPTSPSEAINTGPGTLQITSYSSADANHTATIGYTYTLSAAVINANAEDMAFDDKNLITVTGISGEVSSPADLRIRIIDDAPIASPVSRFTQSTAGQDTNLLITLDISGSMNESSGVGSLSKLSLAKLAAIDLIDQYDALGNVKVELITFGSSANNVSGTWVDAEAAKNYILGLGTSGGTDYDAALLKNMDVVNNVTTGKLTTPGVQNVSYFLSDGAPNESTDWPAIPGAQTSTGIEASEKTVWENFLNTNDIRSYALGMGSSVTASALNPIAYNGAGNGSDTNAIIVTDLSQLIATLATTVSVTPVSGELINSASPAVWVGADGGYIQQITVDEVSYTFDGNNTIISSSSSHAFNFDANTKVLTVSTNAGATMVLDMQGDNIGHYTYNPAASTTPVTESFSYSLIDGDGDTADSTMQFIVNVNESPNQNVFANILNEESAVARDGEFFYHTNTVTDSFTSEAVSDTASVILNRSQEMVGSTAQHGILLDNGSNKIVDGKEGNDMFLAVQNTGGAESNTFISIENLVGFNFADTLTGGTFMLTPSGEVNTITEYGSGDVLDLRNLFSAPVSGPISDFVQYDSETGALSVDTKGATGEPNFVQVAQIGASVPHPESVTVILDSSSFQVI